MRKFYDTHMMGLEVTHSIEKSCINKVYLSYQWPDNYHFHAQYLGKLSNIVEDCHLTIITIIGVLNAVVDEVRIMYPP